MRYPVRIVFAVVSFIAFGAAAFGQESGRNVVEKNAEGIDLRNSSIDGVWTFTGKLLSNSCTEPATLSTLSDTFQIDRDRNAVYATALGDSVEFLGEWQGGEFTIATPQRSTELNESCTQVTTLSMTGNWRAGSASFSIANNFFGSCPGASDCAFVYEGTLTKIRQVTRRYNNNKKFHAKIIKRERKPL